MEKDKPSVASEILLLQTAVDCELLSPKGKWKAIVGRIENHIIELEHRVDELEKIQAMKIIDAFDKKGDD